RLERELRGRAREQAAAERGQARRARVAARERSSGRRRPRGDYEARLHERDARQPPSRPDLHTRTDQTPPPLVAAGGGRQGALEATGLRSFETAAGLIDPAILVRALDNDRLEEQRRPPAA